MASIQPSLYDRILPKLRPFQREAVDFAIHGGNGSSGQQQEGRLLLADEMGCGKTITSLAIMAHYQAEWPLLVVCPASLRYTWPGEIEKFLNLPASAVYVAKGFSDIGFQNRKDIKVVVLTYSLIQDRSAVAHAMNDVAFQCVIVDESHNLKQRDSQRAEFLMPVLTRASRLALLTGTPALNRPCELWTQLHCLQPNMFGSWKHFAERYCGPTWKWIGNRKIRDYSGSSNEEELHEKLSSVMIRRLKSDILHELPPKQRSIVPVEMGPKEDLLQCKLAMKELNEARVNVEEGQADFEVKGKLTQAFQQTGIGKAKAAIDYLLDWLSGTDSRDKILLFCHHRQVMDRIDEALLQKHPNSHIRIDGQVPTAVRAQAVRQFQTSTRVRVALLSMTAAGVGLTLTAASTVVFCELHWTPGVLAQAEDRAHRIGQTHSSVQIVYLVCRDEQVSLDGALWKMLGRKIGTLDQVIDGKDDKPYLYDAKDAEGPAKSKDKAISVQEELTNFFAETEVTELAKKKKPVGGIDRFFIRKGQSKASCQQKKPARTAASTTSARRVSTENSPWTCSCCTLVNSQGLWCEACGTTKPPSSSSPPPLLDLSTDSSTASRPSSAIVSAAKTPGLATTTTTAARSRRQRSSQSQERRRSNDSSDDSELEELLQHPPTHRARKSPESDDHGNKRPPNKARSSVREDENGVLNIDDDDDEPVIKAKKKTNRSTEVIEIDSDDSSDSDSEASAAMREPERKVKAAETRSDKTPETIEIDSDDSSDSEESEDDTSSSARSAKVVPNGRRDPASKATRSRAAPEETSSGDGSASESDDDSSPQAKKVAPVASRGSRVSGTPGVPHPKSTVSAQPAGLFCFSVSRNSGRISIYTGDQLRQAPTRSGLATLDPTDILHDTTNAALQGFRAKPSSQRIEFDKDAISKLEQELRKITKVPRVMSELKEFVASYYRLNETEKRALRDSGLTFPAFDLSRVVRVVAAEKLATTATGGTTERYSGGAKERAVERRKEGSCTQQDTNVLEGKACSWCGKRLPNAVRLAGGVYCNQECKDNGDLKRGGRFGSSNIRTKMFALERGVCTSCNLDCHRLFERVCAAPIPKREGLLREANFNLPKSDAAWKRLIHNPKEGDFWQIDHIEAVADGGGSCGTENLRTLCVPCHQEQTEKQRHRHNLERAAGLRDPSSSKRKQGTLSGYFQPAAGTKKQRSVRTD